MTTSMSLAKKQPSFPAIDIIIALGNPGPEYANTYHNAGARFVHFLRESPLATPPTVESLGTFMNVSGGAVRTFLKKDGIKPDRMLLVHDDVDIPVGEYKFSFGSGAAGHHGVESVIESLGTKDFWRLRIGIAKTIETPDGRTIKKKADTFVLKPISANDADLLHHAFEHAADILNSS